MKVLTLQFTELTPSPPLPSIDPFPINNAEVNELLSQWRVIPLNSPPHYPPYNGGIERAQRDLKGALRPQLIHAAAEVVIAVLPSAVHELNHRPRRCLHGRTACAQFAGAKHNLRAYTARVRKEALNQISERATNNLLAQPAGTQARADAAWRHAVEAWLQHHEIISISQPKTVTSSHENWSH